MSCGNRSRWLGGLCQAVPPLLYKSQRRSAMTIRTQLKAGGIQANHNEALQVRSNIVWCRAMAVRTQLRAGKLSANHNEVLQVRSALKAGGTFLNHNETLQRKTDRPAVSMRRQPLTTSRKDDRLELLVVRAGLRAGRRARARSRA